MSQPSKAKIIAIILGVFVIGVGSFVVIANNIIVDDCVTTCECRLDPTSESCKAIGCTRFTLWDEINCNIKQFFKSF